MAGAGIGALILLSGAALAWHVMKPAPPPAPVAAPPLTPPPSLFIVYFDFDKAVLTQEGLQVVQQAANMRYMSGGQFRLPIVFRGSSGMAGCLAATHSHRLEAWYAHVPGLTVMMPATPADAKGMLKSAIRSDDPVIFMEHEVLYSERGEVPAGEHLVPIGRADIKRPGSDVTLITYSRSLKTTLAAATQLAFLIEPTTEATGPGLGMLCVLGFDGKFHLLDPAWEAALGFSNEELLRQPLMDLIHPEDYTTTCTCARNLWMGVEVRSFENRCRTKDGTYRWLLWNAAAVVSEKLICAAAVDITELKKREEALGPGAVQLPVAG
jgi:PAS domain S-box-containing protein